MGDHRATHFGERAQTMPCRAQASTGSRMFDRDPLHAAAGRPVGNVAPGDRLWVGHDLLASLSFNITPARVVSRWFVIDKDLPSLAHGTALAVSSRVMASVFTVSRPTRCARRCASSVPVVVGALGRHRHDLPPEIQSKSCARMHGSRTRFQGAGQHWTTRQHPLGATLTCMWNTCGIKGARVTGRRCHQSTL